MSYTLPQLKCKFCGHTWVPRKLGSRMCPKCKRCIVCGRHIYLCRCFST